jgi:hypothetical protein
MIDITKYLQYLPLLIELIQKDAPLVKQFIQDIHDDVVKAQALNTTITAPPKFTS